VAATEEAVGRVEGWACRVGEEVAAAARAAAKAAETAATAEAEAAARAEGGTAEVVETAGWVVAAAEWCTLEGTAQGEAWEEAG
jgi:hypothetical protein